MADSEKKGSGLSTGAVVGIGAACFIAGAVTAGCVYEFIFIPAEQEKAKKAPSSGTASTQGGK